MLPIRCGILTISDRSFQGVREDASGPALSNRLIQAGWTVTITGIVPDEAGPIQSKLMEWSDQGTCDLILTTGGTGFARRDITPEATLPVLQRLTPGLSEAMRADSLKKTPHAMLSRGVAGIRGAALIINLPGSPQAALENLETILPVIPHAVELLRESPTSEKGHAFSK